MNVALDKNDQPVILDFGSCRKFGDTLLSGGTPGWIDEDYSISSPLHDEVALGKIKVVVTAAKIRMAGGGKCDFGRVFVVVRVNCRRSQDGDSMKADAESASYAPLSRTAASSHLTSATHVYPALRRQRQSDPWRCSYTIPAGFASIRPRHLYRRQDVGCACDSGCCLMLDNWLSGSPLV